MRRARTFERGRLRPISTSATFFFSSSANSTSANFDFGQFLDVEFLDHKGCDPEGGGPNLGKVGSRSLGPRSLGSQGWGPEGWAEAWGAVGWGAQNFAFFFPFPPLLSFCFPSLGGPFVEFWWCLKPRGAQMCTFGVLWLSCEAPAASGRSRASSDILLLPEGAGVFYTEHSEGNAMISFASQRVYRRGWGGGGATAPSSTCGRPKRYLPQAGGGPLGAL